MPAELGLHRLRVPADLQLEGGLFGLGGQHALDHVAQVAGAGGAFLVLGVLLHGLVEIQPAFYLFAHGQGLVLRGLFFLGRRRLGDLYEDVAQAQALGGDLAELAGHGQQVLLRLVVQVLHGGVAVLEHQRDLVEIGFSLGVAGHLGAGFDGLLHQLLHHQLLADALAELLQRNALLLQLGAEGGFGLLGRHLLAGGGAGEALADLAHAVLQLALVDLHLQRLGFLPQQGLVHQLVERGLLYLGFGVLLLEEVGHSGGVLLGQRLFGALVVGDGDRLVVHARGQLLHHGGRGGRGGAQQRGREEFIYSFHR